MERDAELFYLESNLNYAIIKNQIEFHENASYFINHIAAYFDIGQYILISTDNFIDDLIEDYGGIRCTMKDLYRNKISKTPPAKFLFGDEQIYSLIPRLENTISNIKTVPVISKFTTSNKEWRNPLKGREQLKYNVLHKNVPNEYAIEILGNIYFTNMDTDFILDIDISSLAGFTTKNKIPTVRELYQVYRVAQDEWRTKIGERAIEEGITINVIPKPSYYDPNNKSFKEIIDLINAHRAKKN